VGHRALLEHDGEGAELSVEGGDAIEVRAHQLARGELTGREAARHLGGGEVGELRRGFGAAGGRRGGGGHEGALCRTASASGGLATCHQRTQLRQRNSISMESSPSLPPAITRVCTSLAPAASSTPSQPPTMENQLLRPKP